VEVGDFHHFFHQQPFNRSAGETRFSPTWLVLFNNFGARSASNKPGYDPILYLGL